MKKNWPLIFLMIIFPTYSSTMKDAKEAFSAGDYEKALSLVNQDSKFDTADSELALLIRGEATFHSGDFSSAESLYKQFIDNYPKSTFIDDARYGLGWSLKKLEKKSEASEEFSKITRGERSLESQILSGRMQMELKKYGPAMISFQTASTLDKNGDFTQYIQYSLGEIEYYAGNFKNAAAFFLRAAESQGDNKGQSWFSAARCFILAKDLDNAKKCLDNAAQYPALNKEITSLISDSGIYDNIKDIVSSYDKLSSPSADLPLTIAQSLADKGHFAEAFKFLEEKAEKNDQSVLYHQIIYSYKANMMDKVAEKGLIFINNHKNHKFLDEIILLTAESLAYLKRYDEALKLLEKNQKNNENKDDSLLIGAYIHLLAGNVLEAEKTIKPISKDSKSWPDTRFIMGEINLKSGKNDKAMPLYQEAISGIQGRFADHSKVRLARNHILRGNGQRGEALLKQILEKPGSAVEKEALFSLAEMHKLRGNYDESLKYYNSLISVLETGSLSIEAHNGAGWCYFTKGQFHRALSSFGLAESLSPQQNKAKPLYWKGKTWYELNELERAIDIFKTIEEQYPSFPDADYTIFKLGRCYERLGRNKEARMAYERLRKKHPLSRWSDEARNRLRLL